MQPWLSRTRCTFARPVYTRSGFAGRFTNPAKVRDLCSEILCVTYVDTRISLHARTRYTNRYIDRARIHGGYYTHLNQRVSQNCRMFFFLSVANNCATCEINFSSTKIALEITRIITKKIITIENKISLTKYVLFWKKVCIVLKEHKIIYIYVYNRRICILYFY